MILIITAKMIAATTLARMESSENRDAAKHITSVKPWATQSQHSGGEDYSEDCDYKQRK
jgi:hypothetical protein